MIGDPGDPRPPAARRFGRSQGITVSVLATLLIVTGVAAVIANRPLSTARPTASTQTPQGPTPTLSRSLRATIGPNIAMT